MDFFEVIEKRRSIRKYEQRPIEEEKIEKLIEAALRSPSSRGLQPWGLVVVTNRDTIVRLSQAKEHGASFLAEAPLAMVVYADEEKCDVWVEDASIACTMISLASEALHLGSCWVQIRRRKDGKGQCAEENVRTILDLPAGMRVEAIIAIGYPDEHKPAHRKEELEFSKVSRNG